jgi:ribonuclease-3
LSGALQNALEQSDNNLAELIGHAFARPELLAEALTHPSALPSRRQGGRRPRRTAPRGGYERLEFLGDRVRGLVTADLLWRRFQTDQDAHLTRRLTTLVRRAALARVAATIGPDR